MKKLFAIVLIAGLFAPDSGGLRRLSHPGKDMAPREVSRGMAGRDSLTTAFRRVSQPSPEKQVRHHGKAHDGNAETIKRSCSRGDYAACGYDITLPAFSMHMSPALITAAKTQSDELFSRSEPMPLEPPPPRASG